MLKNTILQHKLERDKLLAEKYVNRQGIDYAKKFLSSDLIKVVLGPRRAGKSVFCFLLLKGRNFAYIDFDDENLRRIKDYDDILKGILEVYGDTEYILFDEIQNLPNWELFTNKLQRRGYNLVLTGSNANLLSHELGTALTGRYIPFELMPFSFQELLTVKNFKIEKEYFNAPEYKGKLLNYLVQYLKQGGFPEVAVKGLDPKIYLETLFDSIILTDAVKRHKVRFSRKIYDLAVYLVSNFAREFSFNKLKNILDFNSTATVQNYLKYLEESYLVFSLNRFSFKTKEQIKAPKKIYLIDNGFVAAKAFQFSQDLGYLMENLILVELLRRKYRLNQELFYYKTRNQKEVDFVLRKGLAIQELMQICYDFNIETKKREIRALIEAAEELKCDNLTVITWDYESQEAVKGKKIKFIPLYKWLLK